MLGAPNIVQVIHIQDSNVTYLPVCPVKHFSLVAINGQVVTVGGRNMSDDSVSNKLYSWYEASRQWEESLPPIPRQCCTLLSAAITSPQSQ